MDIRAQLLKEHSRQNAETIAAYVGGDADRFAVLMRLVLHDDWLVGQRAAYSMALVCERQPHLATPYVERLLHTLDAPVHQAVQRNSIRTLQFCELPEPLHGRITEAMFARVGNPKAPLAQRAFAITVALRMAAAYPELQPELRLLLENALHNDPGPAVRSRATKALARLQRTSANAPH